MKKIAVLIPSFCPEHYLLKCFESIESQTLDKALFKVYLALNGPREPFEKFVKDALSKYSFENEFFYLETAGVSNARNHLIDASEEEYIVFIDDDDLVSSSYLEELLNATNSSVMGISNIQNFESTLDKLKPNYIGKTFHSIKDMEESKLKFRKYLSSPCAKMLHRDMVNSVRFDTHIAKGEDSLFIATASPNISAVNKTSEKACYFVYERSGSATRKSNKRPHEIKVLNYLMFQYIKLFINRKYDKLFILTRLLATTIKYLKLFKPVR